MCDCLVALSVATADGRTLFAKNSDRPPNETQVLRWIPAGRDERVIDTTYISIDGHRGDTLGCVLSMPSWCWGGEHGVNETSVAVGNETIYTTLDPRGAPEALIGMDLVRLALQRASTASDAVTVITELLERYGQGGSGHDTSAGQRPRPYWSSFLVADPVDAWVVETSGRTIESMRVEKSWAISNRTTIPTFDAVHRHPRQPVDRLVDPRLNASRAVLAAEPVKSDSLRMHLASHVGGENGWTVCMHAVEDGKVVEVTTASMVVELAVTGWRGWFTQTSPCTAEWMEIDSAGAADALSGR